MRPIVYALILACGMAFFVDDSPSPKPKTPAAHAATENAPPPAAPALDIDIAPGS